MLEFLDVKQACRALSQSQLQSILGVLLGREHYVHQRAYTLSVEEALLIWLADLLEWMQVCNSDERTLFLHEIREELSGYADKLGACLNDAGDTLPAFMIGFVDRKYATCTGIPKFFDLHEGLWIEKLPEPALEVVSYACTTLYMRNHQIIKLNHGRSNDAEHS
jgi:hypothetical protein